jgi:hypothetical protein
MGKFLDDNASRQAEEMKTEMTAAVGAPLKKHWLQLSKISAHICR